MDSSRDRNIRDEREDPFGTSVIWVTVSGSDRRGFVNSPVADVSQITCCSTKVSVTGYVRTAPLGSVKVRFS